MQRLGLPVQDLQHLHTVLTRVIAAANRPGDGGQLAPDPATAGQASA
ncbi:hypothetical protein [Micromonospora vulcania]|uniref:MarR family transcriptional regulator n=1 Tax=Micromonospora vulcania TaxID=1441873 RepID=A0ABW1H8Q7_9ACTN